MVSRFTALFVVLAGLTITATPAVQKARGARKTQPSQSPPQIQKVQDRTVPFKPGETLRFDVSWNGYVTAGTAVLTVKARRETGVGRAVYDIVGEAQPSALLQKLYRLSYRTETHLDTRTLLPTLATISSDERGRTKLKTTRFVSLTSVEYEVKTATTSKTVMSVPRASQDPLSALFVLRALQLRGGEAITIPISSDGKVYQVRVAAGARETITTGAGTIPADRLTLTVKDSRGQPATTRMLALWLSADARRLPLKLEAGLPVGSFVMSLAQAQ